MAEIALLTALIPKLASLLGSEVQLHRNIRKDVESIKSELECMTPFLIAVDSTEETIWENYAWVSQVREAAFEAQDIVDEFFLHFAKDQLDPRSSSTSCTCRLISLMKNVGAQRDIAIRMQDIRSKFVDIRDRNERYKTGSFKPVNGPADTDSSCYDTQRDVNNLNKDELLGTKAHEEELINMLIGTKHSARTNVVSVYGMGGVGKTSLVKKVYDNAEVRKHFIGQVWITVSRTFEPDDILKDLIRSLTKDMTRTEPDELGNVQSGNRIRSNLQRNKLQQRAMELLGTNKYLIIFDDVWDTCAWNSIWQVLPEIISASQIMITTRDKTTALTASSGCKARIYELKPLSFDTSLKLFYTKIFGSTKCPRHLNDVSISILKKCGGLPLAIIAIAGVLISKDATAQSDEWGRIDLSLREEFKMTQRILSLSFMDLPYKLKPCFLYLSIFPKDHLIQKERLLKLWIAEGFVERGDFSTLEEAAESNLEELINRSLIQVVDITDDGRVESCRIHDLLRKMILKKAMDQRFAALAREYDDLRSLKTRRISLSTDLTVLQNSSIGFGQLRSLFMFNGKQPVNVSMPALFSDEFNFKLLTVLDLQGTILDKFPSTIVKLENLKYLNLSHTDVRQVPSSISRLWRLETLNLRSTLVSKLPKAILKLQRLRDLLLYHRRDEVKIMVSKHLQEYKVCNPWKICASLMQGSIVSLMPRT